MALQQVYAQALVHGNEQQATQLLSRWISWARRCRLALFKKLAGTLRDRLPAVVRGMLADRSNAYVEAMCQRRLKFDPLSRINVGMNLTHPKVLDRGRQAA